MLHSKSCLLLLVINYKEFKKIMMIKRKNLMKSKLIQVCVWILWEVMKDPTKKMIIVQDMLIEKMMTVISNEVMAMLIQIMLIN